MELELGLALPSNPSSAGAHEGILFGSKRYYSWSHNNISHDHDEAKNKKRSFDEALVDQNSKQTLTLPLLSWNDKPNEDDHHRNNLHHHQDSSHIIDKNTSDQGNNVVGWPPINIWRRKFYNQSHEGSINNINHMNTGGGGSNSMYVKVKMEGLAIGRKIDLGLHNSYQTLTNALTWMFGKYDGVQGTKIVYQDKEGDWLLVGDVPWKSFVQSVQRLKILSDNI